MDNSDNEPATVLYPPPSPDELPPMVCPNCFYDVRGLSENRCPECGELFDAHTALRLARDEREPIPKLQSYGERPIFGAVQTFIAVLFHPTSFAKQFPHKHSPGVAILYSAGCYAVASIILLIGLGIMGYDAIKAFPGMGFGMIFSATITEILIARLLAWFIEPTGIRNKYHYFRGLTHMGSGFLCLTCLVLCVVGNITYDIGSEFSLFILILSLVIVFIWWVVAISKMIRSRLKYPGMMLIVVPTIIGCGIIGWVGGFFLSVFLISVLY